MVADRQTRNIHFAIENIAVSVQRSRSRNPLALRLVAVEPIFQPFRLAHNHFQERRSRDGGIFPVRLFHTQAQPMWTSFQEIGVDAQGNLFFLAAQADASPVGEIVVEPEFILGQRLRKGGEGKQHQKQEKPTPDPSQREGKSLIFIHIIYLIYTLLY